MEEVLDQKKTNLSALESHRAELEVGTLLMDSLGITMNDTFWQDIARYSKSAI